MHAHQVPRRVCHRYEAVLVLDLDADVCRALTQYCTLRLRENCAWALEAANDTPSYDILKAAIASGSVSLREDQQSQASMQ